MDPNMYLILLNGSDKTSDVEKIESVNNKVEVQFKNITKKYTYGKTKVLGNVKPNNHRLDVSLLNSGLFVPRTDSVIRNIRYFSC